MGLIESFTGNFFILNGSLLLTVAGLAVYWFGIFYNKMSPAEVDKNDHYTSGTLFILQYVAFSLFIYAILKFVLISHFPQAFVDALINLYYLGYGVLAITMAVLLLGLSQVLNFSRNIEMKFTEVGPDVFSITYLYSIFAIVTTFFLIDQEIKKTHTWIAIAIFFVAFISMSGYAILEGLRRVPFNKVTIEMEGNNESGEPIEGTILKDGAYVHLFLDNRCIKKINRDSIHCINVHRFQYYEIKTLADIRLHTVRVRRLLRRI